MLGVSGQMESVERRRLPKLYACTTKGSLDNFRNRALYSLDVLDAKSIRRLQKAFHECVIQELRDSGYFESSLFLQNIIYDNEQLVEADDLGIIVDLRKRKDYLEHLCDNLQKIEKEHDKGNFKMESLHFLRLALFFAEREKGNFWLAEKIFLVAIAVASQLMTDGGRQKSCCKYHYAKFLLDKFPGLDDEEPYNILTDVRNSAIGKDWLLREADEPGPPETLFNASSAQLHRVLMNLSKKFRLTDAAKAERLARLAERRARDAMEPTMEAAAIIQIGICQLIMNNLNNARKTFLRALAIYVSRNNIDGICETKMHCATVMQRLNNYELAEKLLTEMGIMAMDHGLRKHLGRALHLLGELHLMREKPEFGTHYLTEAFACFMGFIIISYEPSKSELEHSLSLHFGEEGPNTKKEQYLEEAERSRLMLAVCKGQELMLSYFNELNVSDTCGVAKTKIMEWKLSSFPWWIARKEDNLVPCMCPTHNRTPLDVVCYRLALPPEESFNDMTRFSSIMSHATVKKLASSNPPQTGD